MNDLGIAIKKIIDRCDVCVDNKSISKELLMKTLIEFLSSTIQKDKHNIGYVLHTGSICFDVILLAYIALSNILFNETNSTDIVESLQEGDLVVYYRAEKDLFKNTRLEFSHIKTVKDTRKKTVKQYAVLIKKRNTDDEIIDSYMIPKSSWSSIVPYQGTSTVLDGRGLKKDNHIRKQFLKEVLDLSEEEISRVIDTSTVVIMTKENALSLIPSISFKFGDKTIKYTELVPVSYYTKGNNNIPLGGNAARIEPVVKLTSRVSVARKLLLRRDGNRNIGLAVLGDELVKRGELELPELISRQSLQYVYVSSNIDSEHTYKMVKTTDDYNLFACTKDFLLTNSLPIVNQNPYTVELSDQVDTIIDKDINRVELNGMINWANYKDFKRAMHFIKTYDYSSEEKDSFIIQTYSLMNLFTTAAFPIKELDQYIADGQIEGVLNTNERIIQLKEFADSFPDYLKERALEVINCLERLYLSLYDECQKYDELKKIVNGNMGKKIVIVVPKAYYGIIFDRYFYKIPVVTANKFNNKELYDMVIVLGNYVGTKFDPFRCRASKSIIVLLYGFEVNQFKYKNKMAKQEEKDYNMLSTIHVDWEEETLDDLDDFTEDETAEIEDIDDEMNQFIEQSFSRAAKSYFSEYNTKNTMAEVIAIAKFDSSEIAFLSKNYVAYVLDEANKEVMEVKAGELAEGDTIIFTRSNDKTRDIVDSLLTTLISEKKYSSEIVNAYEKSKLWKKELREYMQDNDLSPNDIAESMIRNGVQVQENTIKGWLDEDSHTVGPRHKESIVQIALITGNAHMFDYPEEYFNACSLIRKKRIELLKAIGKAIIERLSGERNLADPVYRSVFNHIDELSRILQIDTIKFVNDTMPINLINKPLNIED